jgi:alkylated DNA repair dioxygenase AlkB
MMVFASFTRLIYLLNFFICKPYVKRFGATTIASLSFGAERKFSFKHKQTKQTVSLVLEHGSLLIMKDATQRNWLHSLPKSKK